MFLGFLGFLIFKSKFLLFRVKLCKFIRNNCICYYFVTLKIVGLVHYS